jgi:peptidoglycan DL-endopeptidase CwlO
MGFKWLVGPVGCSTVLARPLVAALGLVLGLVVAATPASAAPNTDDEGGTKALRAALDAAGKGHAAATAKLGNSKKRQLELTLELRRVESELAVVSAEVAAVAAESYRIGRLTPVAMLLNSASPSDFVQRAAGLDMLAQRDGVAMRRLTEAQVAVGRTKAAIDNEVREQQKQVAIMAKKKQDAERALGAASTATGGFVNANSPLAKPAPKNSDGSWPDESCSVNDPTTSGCITPRTLHAMNQAKAAGYKRYVSCYRSGGGGEHPKGRACDFSAASGGFENVNATGGDKSYGDALAAYYVKNASRLGVMYVIWYRQIWMPSSGWRSYGGSGGPASTHTNHVHLSML